MCVCATKREIATLRKTAKIWIASNNGNTKHSHLTLTATMWILTIGAWYSASHRTSIQTPKYIRAHVQRTAQHSTAHYGTDNRNPKLPLMYVWIDIFVSICVSVCACKCEYCAIGSCRKRKKNRLDCMKMPFKRQCYIHILYIYACGWCWRYYSHTHI